MRSHTRIMRFRTPLAGALCAVAGLAAGHLLDASAAPAHKARRGKRAVAVHVEKVVRRPDGSYPTITIDRGVLKAVSGSQLTIDEGYKTVTVDAGGSPVVRLDRAKSTLSALKDGDRVAVIHGPKRIAVRARS
jgi:hypothetical protein